MKLVKQTIAVPTAVGKVKTKAAAKVLVPEGHVTPTDLAKELKTSPKALRKVIRKLKLVRTGKQWHWLPSDKEVTQIKDAYLKSIQPAAPKSAKSVAAAAAKAVAAVEAEAEEEVEEDEEAEEELTDAPEHIKIDPAI